MLFVTSSFPRWAGDSTTPFVLHLAQDLRAVGWDVHVLAPHAPGALRNEWLHGVPVTRFRYAWPASLQTLCYDGGALVKLRSNPLRLLMVPALVAAQALAVVGMLRRGQFALLHSHWLLPQGFTCALAGRTMRRPHVATAHGGDVFALRGPLSRAAKRIVLRLADAVTVNSEATRRALLPLAARPERIVRIPMGSGVTEDPDPREVAQLRAALRGVNGPLLAFVGRLVPEKGAADLIEAVSLVAQAFPEVRAAFIGDGPERDSLESLTRKLGVEPRIRFIGWLEPEAVHRHLLAADTFVAPSRPAPDGWVEAQGLSVVEAMLAGRPIVASAVGGIPEAIRHEETGLLVEPASPRQLADAIIRLASDGALAARLAQAARKFAHTEFTREMSARRFSEVYARVAGAEAGLRSK